MSLAVAAIANARTSGPHDVVHVLFGDADVLLGRIHDDRNVAGVLKVAALRI